MKVSIITVCKNAADSIEETLKSVFFQTYENIEYIVIDGGSDDGTLDILDKYKDKISYVISEIDNGIYNAMNKGIEASNGNVLYFLNANDVLYNEDVIKSIVKQFETTPRAGMVFGDIMAVENGVQTLSKMNSFKNISGFFCESICHQAIFYKKELFEEFGKYNENYKIVSDYQFNLKVLTSKKYKAKYVDMIIANFEKGGFCSNKEYFELFKKEITQVSEKYFPLQNKIVYKYFENTFLGAMVKKIDKTLGVDSRRKVFRKILLKSFDYKVVL